MSCASSGNPPTMGGGRKKNKKVKGGGFGFEGATIGTAGAVYAGNVTSDGSAAEAASKVTGSMEGGRRRRRTGKSKKSTRRSRRNTRRKVVGKRKTRRGMRGGGAMAGSVYASFTGEGTNGLGNVSAGTHVTPADMGVRTFN